MHGCVCMHACATHACAHKTERKREKQIVDGMFNSMKCLQYII